jgi:hypothetical protein
VTDNASNAASLLLDLGTTSGGQFLALTKTGDLTGKTFKPTALVVNGTAGAGYLEFAEQSGVPAVVSGKLRMHENSSDELVITYDDHNPGGADNPAINFRSLVNGTRRYTFPNFGTQLMQYDSDLNALANNSSNGLWAHVSAGTGAARTLVAGSSKISISNGDGVSGNPSFDVVEANLTLSNLGGQVPLATKVSGTLPVANGGTGFTSWTSANIATTTTDETGSGGSPLLVFNQNPTLNGLTVTGSNPVSIASSNAATLQGTGSATAKITSAASTVVEATGSASVTISVNGSTRATYNSSGNVDLTGKATTYNNIATAGTGLPIIVKHTRVTGQTAANSSICTYTAPASDGSYEVSANMNVTASTTLSTTLTCTYTDESNTARTMILPVTSLNGTMVAAGAISGAGASVWETPVMHIRVKASTAITILTSTGTFTGVTYTAEGCIRQIQ